MCGKASQDTGNQLLPRTVFAPDTMSGREGPWQAGVKACHQQPDAHAPGDLDWMRYGVITARRAWLTKDDVINCLSYSETDGAARLDPRGSGWLVSQSLLQPAATGSTSVAGAVAMAHRA